jgi:hypothetical protein
VETQLREEWKPGTRVIVFEGQELPVRRWIASGRFYPPISVDQGRVYLHVSQEEHYPDNAFGVWVLERNVQLYTEELWAECKAIRDAHTRVNDNLLALRLRMDAENKKKLKKQKADL